MRIQIHIGNMAELKFKLLAPNVIAFTVLTGRGVSNRKGETGYLCGLRHEKSEEPLMELFS